MSTKIQKDNSSKTENIFICLISLRKYQIDRQTKTTKLFGASIPASQEYIKKIRETAHPELEISLYLYK